MQTKTTTKPASSALIARAWANLEAKQKREFRYQALVRRFATTHTTIDNWMTGKILPPSYPTREAIAKLLTEFTGVAYDDVDKLFGE